MVFVGAKWLASGLHSRPDDDNLGRGAARASMPLTRDTQAAVFLQGSSLQRVQDEYSGYVPFTRGGIINLRNIVFPPDATTLGFLYFTTVSDGHFKSFFGVDYAQLIHKMRPMGMAPRNIHNPVRYKVRKGKTKAHVPSVPQRNLPPQFPELNDIQPEGNPLDQLDDPMGGLDDEEPHARDLALPTVAQEVDGIFAQYVSDVMQKLANPLRDRAAPSYTPLTLREREGMELEHVNVQNLHGVFTKVQWILAQPDEWAKAFDCLFPPKGHELCASASHYHTMRYYIRWKTLMVSVAQADARCIRQSIRIKFDTLWWVPAALSDRLWDYKAGQSMGFNQLPANLLAANFGGPRIYWRRRPGNPIPTLDNAAQAQQQVLDLAAYRREHAQEEEESSGGE